MKKINQNPKRNNSFVAKLCAECDSFVSKYTKIVSQKRRQNLSSFSSIRLYDFNSSHHYPQALIYGIFYRQKSAQNMSSSLWGQQDRIDVPNSPFVEPICYWSIANKIISFNPFEWMIGAVFWACQYVKVTIYTYLKSTLLRTYKTWIEWAYSHSF